MIKLISSDMDGTLLDSYRQITPINVEAIKRAQENGINFIINTGREYPNARGLVEAAGLKCDLICSNGACAFDKDGNLLFEHILDKETVRTIFDAFNKYGMEPALFTTEGRISLLPLEEREIYTRDVFIPAIQVNHPDMKYTLDDYRELVDDVIFVDGQEVSAVVNHQRKKDFHTLFFNFCIQKSTNRIRRQKHALHGNTNTRQVFDRAKHLHHSDNECHKLPNSSDTILTLPKRNKNHHCQSH
mgnify:CR=1 FL=1